MGLNPCDWLDEYEVECGRCGSNAMRVTLEPDADPITYYYCDQHLRSVVLRIFSEEE